MHVDLTCVPLLPEVRKNPSRWLSVLPGHWGCGIRGDVAHTVSFCLFSPLGVYRVLGRMKAWMLPHGQPGFPRTEGTPPW